jgi:hypothetical protein
MRRPAMSQATAALTTSVAFNVALGAGTRSLVFCNECSIQTLPESWRVLLLFTRWLTTSSIHGKLDRDNPPASQGCVSVVEELIPELVSESCAELDVELVRGGKNRGKESEKGRRCEDRTSCFLRRSVGVLWYHATEEIFLLPQERSS